MFITTAEEFQVNAQTNSRVSFYREIMTDNSTPISLLCQFAAEEYLFLLESAHIDKTFSRFSYFGYQPKEIISYDHEQLKIYNPLTQNSELIKTQTPFDYLEQFLTQESCALHPDFGDFNGGLVGSISYEAVNYTGNLRCKIKNLSSDPVFTFFKIEQFFVLDNHRNRLFAACTLATGSSSTQELYQTASALTAQMELQLASSNIEKTKSVTISPQIQPEFSDIEFIAEVEKIKQQIIAGEGIQIVLSNRFELATKVNAVNFYRALRKINPSPYLFFLKIQDQVICGSSPETHLKVKANQALLKPIAGTYKIASANEPVDKTQSAQMIEELKTALQNDPKEVSEHLMLVDLARNDLHTCCSGVQVTKSFQPEVYSHLIHLVSEVTGTLDPTISSLELFKKTFPAGTVSGAPKVRAIEIIDETETSGRGFYAGCVGYFGYNGDLDTCITIRSAQITKDKIIFRAGAGITAQSQSDKERIEVQTKLEAMFTALAMSNRL